MPPGAGEAEDPDDCTTIGPVPQRTRQPDGGPPQAGDPGQSVRSPS